MTEASRILTGVTVSEALEPRLTVDGLRNLLQDLRAAGKYPKAILVSEHDRREINQDLLAGSTTQVAKQDQAPEHDGVAIAVIEGVIIKSHPDIPRGRARLVYPSKEAAEGDGKVVSGQSVVYG